MYTVVQFCIDLLEPARGPVEAVIVDRPLAWRSAQEWFEALNLPADVSRCVPWAEYETLDQARQSIRQKFARAIEMQTDVLEYDNFRILERYWCFEPSDQLPRRHDDTQQHG